MTAAPRISSTRISAVAEVMPPVGTVWAVYSSSGVPGGGAATGVPRSSGAASHPIPAVNASAASTAPAAAWAACLPPGSARRLERVGSLPDVRDLDLVAPRAA
ncbi:hypothetical protein [Nocardia wallacei]|uniref:hypothetical protein n=1 Tax=Nocardia wallacei TaxID=480035 RepID=UPI002455FBF6|nr:hypothetical protein [Nocardia wallacei]